MRSYGALLLAPSLAACTGREARAPTASPSAPAPSPTAAVPEAVNDARTRDVVRRGAPRSAIVRAQILLDRAHFSAGEIDAVYGLSMRRAVAAFQREHRLAASGEVDAATWAALAADTAPLLVRYVLTPEDVAGPFTPVPPTMTAKSTLPALNYASLLEEVGERFHVSPDLLVELNPGRSTGSHHDPLPIGTWRITGVLHYPPFHYDPQLFWDAQPTDRSVTIQPGPNNPVGTVWMDLSKLHYGIHGTPEPSSIGHTQSHGCIRLTNWSAEEVAQMVEPGTPAILRQ